MGFDARELTPLLVLRVVFATAETRSYKRAAIVVKHVGGQAVSAKTIERVTHDVGDELRGRRDADVKRGVALAKRPERPPDLAVVECDGGRIRTREPGHGPGVHLRETGWRETKNACLIRATLKISEKDPQPEPPACFCDPEHVAAMAQTAALPVASAPPDPEGEGEAGPRPGQPEGPAPPPDWRPKRLVRTVLASIACSKDFGKQMACEAKRRRFSEAKAKAFLGDGLPQNWSIKKRHFSDYTAILDFIHVLSYLFLAAKAAHERDDDAWDQYLVWMRGAWRGEIEQVLEELNVWQAKRGEPPEAAPESDPRQILATAIGYLKNNRKRMNYAEYRRNGLPVTTAWMESLVKEMNYRVKGTEMFWNDPEGAEAILQVRAAALCDDDRLVDHLNSRPGNAFTRRPKSPIFTAKKIRS